MKNIKDTFALATSWACKTDIDPNLIIFYFKIRMLLQIVFYPIVYECFSEEFFALFN